MRSPVHTTLSRSGFFIHGILVPVTQLPTIRDPARISYRDLLQDTLRLARPLHFVSISTAPS
jgi:hypothetical protein